MGTIALKVKFENHQWCFEMVEKGMHTSLNHDQLADLFEAKRLYFKAVIEGGAL